MRSWTGHCFTAGVSGHPRDPAPDVIAKSGRGAFDEDHTFDNFRAFCSQLFYQRSVAGYSQLNRKVWLSGGDVEHLGTHQVHPHCPMKRRGARPLFEKLEELPV
jgi:hypothetical protein